ncbi:MAG: Lrp/AsnC family transcriptional regulator [Anaerolineaceae bacterium]|nr:Lrp/AsnC family transcriptional regulator [Anaerolineaceae bacterium]
MSESLEMDKLDFAIITQLQDDGRRSYTEIARALDVSVGTIRNRVTRMVEEGIVRFICRPDAYRIGFHTPANIKVSIRPSSLIKEAVEAIAEFPEVYYLALITGEYDLDIDVMCCDQEHLANLVAQRLSQVQGVNALVTSVILRTYKLSVPDLRLVNPFV